MVLGDFDFAQVFLVFLLYSIDRWKKIQTISRWAPPKPRLYLVTPSSKAPGGFGLSAGHAQGEH